jgi:hypothetical protein
MAMLGIITEFDKINTRIQTGAYKANEVKTKLEGLFDQIRALRLSLDEQSSWISRLGRCLLCIGSWGQCAVSQEFEIERDEYNLQTAIDAVQTASSEFATYRAESAGALQNSLDNIQGYTWTISDNQVKAKNAVSKGGRETRKATAESIATDPWTRHLFTAQSQRAKKTFERAQKLTFIARRAIEFKFVADFERLTNPMLMGDIPKGWARDVFLNGYTSDEPLEGFMKPTVDYINHLNDFVDFYSASFPFQNGTTTVVLSLKDHIIGSLFSCCPGPTDCYVDDPNNNWDKRLCQKEYLYDGNNKPIMRPDGQSAFVLHPQYDYDGVLMKNAIRQHCENGDVELNTIDQDCATANDPVARPNYYVYRFAISLDDYNMSGKLATLGVSAQNYNYRVRNIAVNLVGSNVKNCSLVQENSAACYASAFIPYDFVQTGKVKLRDHDLVQREYELPKGGILNGKALAAERTITTPVANADLELISQYWAQEFQGRPFQGEFEIRLYNVESFDFLELTDVQIVVQLDYWSPFSL